MTRKYWTVPLGIMAIFSLPRFWAWMAEDGPTGAYGLAFSLTGSAVLWLGGWALIAWPSVRRQFHD